ncbi:hypothetical protein [Belnapia rosea]|uniref:hypothetical protein n=1 Tax=Belnapia rosea TaxID=938405 RepID=UPI00115FD637|nr:hypothetical protein [Belnapia rosea]
MSDPTSLAGKAFPLRQRVETVVVGAGEAGIAAATACPATASPTFGARISPSVVRTPRWHRPR